MEEAAAGSSLVGERGFELVRFLWRPGEAEAVRLCLGGGEKRSVLRAGLERAPPPELADQVELSGGAAWPLFCPYASAACRYLEVALGAR